MLIGLNFNFAHSVSSCMGFIPLTKPLPASVSCVPPSHGPAQSEAPCLLLLAHCHACLTSCTWEWNVLVLWWSCLEDQPALLDTSNRQKMQRPRSALLKFRFVILLLILIIPLRILNFTITWLLQTTLPCPRHLNHLLFQSMKSKLIFNNLENTRLLLSLFTQ